MSVACLLFVVVLIAFIGVIAGNVHHALGWWVTGLCAAVVVLGALGVILYTVSYFYGGDYSWPFWALYVYLVYQSATVLFGLPLEVLREQRKTEKDRQKRP